MNSLPIIFRQGAAAAQRTAGKSKVADLLQQCTRINHAFGLLSLRSISSTSASKDADDGRPGISGTPGKGLLILYKPVVPALLYIANSLAINICMEA